MRSYSSVTWTPLVVIVLLFVRCEQAASSPAVIQKLTTYFPNVPLTPMDHIRDKQQNETSYSIPSWDSNEKKFCTLPMMAVPQEERCQYVEECLASESLIDYDHLAMCGGYSTLVLLAMAIPWLIALFYVNGILADSYLTIAIVEAGRLLNILDSLAGCAMLAIVNAMGDLLTGFHLALSSPKDIELFMGDVIGAGGFLSTLVVGAVILSSPTNVVELVKSAQLRDLAFHSAGMLTYAVFALIGNVPPYISAPLIFPYFIYIYMAWCQTQNEKDLTASFTGSKSICETEKTTIIIGPYADSPARSVLKGAGGPKGLLASPELSRQDTDSALSSQLNACQSPNVQTLTPTYEDHFQINLVVDPEDVLYQITPSTDSPGANEVKASRDTPRATNVAHLQPLTLGKATNQAISLSLLKSYMLENSFLSNPGSNMQVASYMTRGGKHLLLSQTDLKARGLKSYDDPTTSFLGDVELASLATTRNFACRILNFFKAIVLVLTKIAYLIFNLTIPCVGPTLNWFWLILYPICIATFFYLQQLKIRKKNAIYTSILPGALISGTTAVVGICVMSMKYRSIQAGRSGAATPIYVFKINRCTKLMVLTAGIGMSVIWVKLLVIEIVNCITSLGHYFNVSNDVLGLTVMSWGNSIPDLFANVAVAKAGYTLMGITSCYGSTVFLLYFGSPLIFIVASVQRYFFGGEVVSPILHDRAATVCMFFMIVTNAGYIVYVYRQGRIRKKYGLIPLAFFVVINAWLLLSHTVFTL